MSILIKGMEMPTTCVQCRFRCYDPYREPSDGLGKGTNVCWFTQEEIWNTQRGEQCPLIELPPHGDLIDRDKLEKGIDNYIGGEESRSRFHHWVQVQSVVIPGNKGAET